LLRWRFNEHTRVGLLSSSACLLRLSFPKNQIEQTRSSRAFNLGFCVFIACVLRSWSPERWGPLSSRLRRSDEEKHTLAIDGVAARGGERQRGARRGSSITSSSIISSTTTSVGGATQGPDEYSQAMSAIA